MTGLEGLLEAADRAEPRKRSAQQAYAAIDQLDAHRHFIATMLRVVPASANRSLGPTAYSVTLSALRAPIPLSSVNPAADDATTLQSLIERVSLGQRAAFASLYQATAARLFGIVLRINPDRAQAEDVLQEVYVNVWRAAGTYDAVRAQPMTWLTGIARHRAIDSLRRNRVRGHDAAIPLSSMLGDDDEPRDARLATDVDEPLDLLEKAANARAVTHCVESLTVQQKQCIALAYYQGLSHSEIASQLVEPLGSVKSWLRRALLALKDCLTHSASKAEER